MQIFSDQTFRAFIGEPSFSKNHNWGSESRYSISKQTLEKFRDIFRDTLYSHHSSFSLYDDIAKLGFVLSAQTLKKRHAGNPTDLKTRMCNLGEVLGAQFAQTYLGYQTTRIFPKRLNPNVEQSMKGIDILGFKDIGSPPEILIGEVKAGKPFDARVIKDAYETLAKHKKNSQMPIILHFAKEYFAHQGDKVGEVNVEHHMNKAVQRKYLLLSITEVKAQHPFDGIPQHREQYGEIMLLAVHIEIKGLRDSLDYLFS